MVFGRFKRSHDWVLIDERGPALTYYREVSDYEITGVSPLRAISSHYIEEIPDDQVPDEVWRIATVARMKGPEE